MDSMRYSEDLHVDIPEGSHLTLVAADWPAVETDPGVFERFPGIFSPDRLRPHLRGNIEIAGTAPARVLIPGACRSMACSLKGRFPLSQAISGVSPSLIAQ